MSDEIKIGNVMYPAADVDAAVEFYSRGLGLPIKFRDGARFAALDGGTTTLAIAGPEEDLTGGRPAASFKVGDVLATIDQLLVVGAELEAPAQEGPHEVRAVLRDPWGNPFVIYSAR